MLNFNIDIIYIFILAQLVKNVQLFENRQEISKLSCDFMCKKKRGFKTDYYAPIRHKNSKVTWKNYKKASSESFCCFPKVLSSKTYCP